ncbi:hypothetical protein A1Q1_04755 [Trichosporon asahii var. asahii CBS 2479]|uniref:Uncharacterized protein n=1 Tax=Trichosporon asahii var. asahii (strain ATCC 90039 / CBS 2479 / JCM 2466 / KCTC 7840 / NBRC 103889/ NCYC 2677 / UAMH 7654) TaxID=1186058 RepID=J5QC30_TRIAS|nr:hypothetical protein A1Q1_04755 [Trichosporon asahii var. asahii CBS 2479]EJT46578.1 hypothetical protein A1Q1_04755 [Trichosporon asahii var. asahii CBS 2479]
MDNNTTTTLLLQLTSTLAQVADKKEPYQEQKWILTIIAFAVSGAAVIVTILSHIVSNRCWNMLSPTTKCLSLDAARALNFGKYMYDPGPRTDASGNEIRGTSYWKLLLGEPELRILILGDGFFIDLCVLACPPVLIAEPVEAGSEEWCKIPQHQLMTTAPNSLRCSAYTLAETINQARLLRSHDLLDVNPFWLEQRVGTQFPREVFEIKYEFIKITSDRIIDTGTTYGIRIPFAEYWCTLTTTRTKWSTFKHSSGSEGLVATSVWGTMPHVPSTTKFSDLWGDTPHGMPIVRREEANDSATRLLNLKERCKSVIECWEVQGAMAQGGKGHLSASDVNVLHIAELFKQWKEKDIPEMPEKHSFEYGYPEPAEPSGALTDHAAQVECKMGLLLSSVFSDPGQGVLRNIPKRLRYGIDAKPPAELKEWKQGVVVGCLELIYRIDSFCDDVRVIPDVAELIRPWEWRTAYIV